MPADGTEKGLLARGVAPDLTSARAHWLTRDLIAWPADGVGDPALQDWRLHHAPGGGLVIDAEDVTGGSSVPLTYDPAGPPAAVLEDFPHLEGYLALRLDRATTRQAAELLRDQVAVARSDDLGRLQDATGVQIPGVLDDLEDGYGTRHLKALAEAGMNTVHLLPTFDIVSIPEDRGDPSDVATPDCDLESFAPDGEEQQACVVAQADGDAFNWGYDPWHFSTPEGSYASTAEAAHGGERVAEFRTTCCQNVATEHAMGGTLMVDSVVVWARDYKVGGFRFDLMGHHSRDNMEAVRAGLDALTVRKDGVDGAAVTLYGEGWNFGEVADDARFYQAAQGQLDGTSIATFNDRLRDGVRGGGPFDEDPGAERGRSSSCGSTTPSAPTSTPPWTVWSWSSTPPPRTPSRSCRG